MAHEVSGRPFTWQASVRSQARKFVEIIVENRRWNRVFS